MLFIKISFYSRTKLFLMWELGLEFCPYFVQKLAPSMFMQYVFLKEILLANEFL